MSAILRVVIISLVLQWVLCNYQPWEQIKKGFHLTDHDRVGADARNAIEEKACADAIGTNVHNGLEICFDECMFRNAYHLLTLETSRHQLVYGINVARGIEHMRKNLFRTSSKTISDNTELFHFSDFLSGLLHCEKQEPSFKLPLESKAIVRSHNDSLLCARVLDREQNYKVGGMILCMLKELSLINLPVGGTFYKNYRL